jgi:hypothetical protein
LHGPAPHAYGRNDPGRAVLNIQVQKLPMSQQTLDADGTKRSRKSKSF